MSSIKGILRWHSNNRRPWCAQSGFTLLELIVSFLLLGLLTSIFGMGLVGAMKSHEFSRANAQLAAKSQLAMARISKELMELTEIEAISNASAGDDPFILYRRLVRDNHQATGRMGLHFNTADQTVRLYTGFTGSGSLDGTTSAQGDTLIDGVDSFSLSYFQGDTGTTWNSGNDFRLLSTIEIQLSLERPENPGQTQSFTALVHLRNTRNFGGATPSARPASRDSYGCFIASATLGWALYD